MPRRRVEGQGARRSRQTSAHRALQVLRNDDHVVRAGPALADSSAAQVRQSGGQGADASGARCVMAPWVVMWTTAGSLYAACKWLSYSDARARGVDANGRSLAYLLLWPGMDAAAFLSAGDRVERPAAAEWLAAALKTGFGIGLTWFGAR